MINASKVHVDTWTFLSMPAGHDPELHFFFVVTYSAEYSVAASLVRLV